MSAPLRIGFVGAGAIARAYAAAMEQSDHADLVAIADTDKAAALRLAEETGAVAFTSHLDLARNAGCDAAVVATPPSTHADIVIDLLGCGIPVLCEKPLSIDASSARRMIAAAEDAGLLLSMASKFRFTEDVIAARDMIRAGLIGTPLMLENTFTGVADMTRRWNAVPAVSGGGVLIDNGTHSVDLIRYLMGPIDEVVASPAPRIQDLQVEDGVTMLARSRGGAEARVETSWSIHKDRSAFIEIYGTEGCIEIGWKVSRLRRQHGGSWETFGNGYDKVASFTRQIDNFAGVLREQEHELVSTEDALASVLVIEAAYTSMRSGRWEKVGSGLGLAATAKAAE